MNVLQLPRPKSLAEKIVAARQAAKVHIHFPAEDKTDRETWAQRKMDDALKIYRDILGAAALQARLQRAIEEERQLVRTDGE